MSDSELHRSPSLKLLNSLKRVTEHRDVHPDHRRLEDHKDVRTGIHVKEILAKLQDKLHANEIEILTQGSPVCCSFNILASKTHNNEGYYSMLPSSFCKNSTTVQHKDEVRIESREIISRCESYDADVQYVHDNEKLDLRNQSKTPEDVFRNSEIERIMLESEMDFTGKIILVSILCPRLGAE